MSKAEILSEIAKLGVEERAEVFERMCELQDDDLIRGAGPSAAEKQLLDRALDEFHRDRDRGTPWREALWRTPTRATPSGATALEQDSSIARGVRR